MQLWAGQGMRLLDILIDFDAALDWPLDDPFLIEDETSVHTWTAVEDLPDAA